MALGGEEVKETNDIEIKNALKKEEGC